MPRVFRATRRKSLIGSTPTTRNSVSATIHPLKMSGIGGFVAAKPFPAALAHDDVVGPFDKNRPGILRVYERSDRFSHGKARDQAQRGKLRRRHPGTQQKRQVQAAFGTCPRAPLASVAAGLSAGTHGQALGLPCLQRTLDHVVRGRHLGQFAQAKRWPVNVGNAVLGHTALLCPLVFPASRTTGRVAGDAPHIGIASRHRQDNRPPGTGN